MEYYVQLKNVWKIHYCWRGVNIEFAATNFVWTSPTGIIFTCPQHKTKKTFSGRAASVLETYILPSTMYFISISVSSHLLSSSSSSSSSSSFIVSLSHYPLIKNQIECALCIHLLIKSQNWCVNILHRCRYNSSINRISILCIYDNNSIVIIKLCQLHHI